MADDSNAASGNIARFQDLLRELFQFDCADLDFGIYRIMNHKRDAIERFITEKLPAAINTELEQGALAGQAEAAAALEEARRNVLSALGESAFDAAGELDEAFRGTPFGQAYLEAKARAGASRSSSAVADSVYNHLYTFFNRYYDEGDFISQRRYSRSQRYAIPYNGEEVYLHWANSDQYYVKTDEHFRNYDFVTPNGVSVHFRLQSADVEQNNIKGDKRFFLPVVDGIEWDAASRAVTIPFEYRPLTGAEKTRYGSQGQQDKIIARAAETIPGLLGDAPEAVGALTAEHRRSGNGPVSRLQHHLVRYTRRNNSDFFIHKDLHGFLNRELDFYLKNEVLNLDEVASAGERMADGWFQQMRLIKTAGGKITDFLAQIEGFQKMLWEKRKFVTGTHYCITLGNIDSALYADIAATDAQWKEWRDLYGIDGSDRNEAFLQAHPTLVLDTKHFTADFTDRLLASLDDLAAMTDGLLIHSENWQALRLLEGTYSGKINCIYIDPPFNAPSSEILYKNDYKHSSWLSLIENRISITNTLLADGVYVIAVDENEQERLGLLIEATWLGGLRRVCVAVRHNPRGIQGKNFSHSHEYAYFMYPSDSRKYIGERKMEVPDVRNLRDSGLESDRRDARNCFYPVVVKDMAVIGTGEVPDDQFHPTGVNEYKSDDTIWVWPIDTKGFEKKWRYAKQSVSSIISKLEARTTRGKTEVYFTKNTGTVRTLWTESQFDASEYGTKLLQDIFGVDTLDFSYPKSLFTLLEIAKVCTEYQQPNYVLDYFAGSGTMGHAVINLNREDGGQRKFILVEMGEYFDTVLLPRMKKVTFAPEWKDGRPKREATPEEAERSPRIVKCIRLESYEDALDSIAFDDAAGQMRLTEESDEYLLKYMLRWETKASETLLNASELTSPFAYRLRVHANGERQERTVDVPETFNYLLGLNVRTRRTYDDDGRRYLVYRGETRAEPGREVAVIWRETAGWSEDDFERDRRFVVEQEQAAGADIVYVNGDSAIPNARAIEPLFKARMFAGVNAE